MAAPVGNAGPVCGLSGEAEIGFRTPRGLKIEDPVVAAEFSGKAPQPRQVAHRRTVIRQDFVEPRRSTGQIHEGRSGQEGECGVGKSGPDGRESSECLNEIAQGAELYDKNATHGPTLAGCCGTPTIHGCRSAKKSRTWDFGPSPSARGRIRPSCRRPAEQPAPHP